MKPPLTLRSSHAFVREYRSLLTSDWSEGLDHAGSILDFLRRQLKTGRLILEFPWEAPPRKRRGPRRPQVTPVPAGASEHLAQFLERANARAAEPLEAVELPRKPDIVDQIAMQAWALLSIQSDWNLEGDHALFRDTQSLLFLSAIHDILPALQNAGRLREHSLLVATMWWHATSVQQNDAVHALHLQARLHEYLGQIEAAREHLFLAFRMTAPSEHDYLTRAQAYWSLLMDEGSRNEAGAFALQLYREAPAEALDEVRELVARSFAELAAHVSDR